MKKIYGTLLALLILHSGCDTMAPLSKDEASVILRVEYNNTGSLRPTVLQLLRTIRIKELAERHDGSVTEIEVTYVRKDIPRGKLGEIKDDLEGLSGVLFVEIKGNAHPLASEQTVYRK